MTKSKHEELRIMRVEAGRKGGQATAKCHEKDFYQRIGRKGGVKGGSQTAKTHGMEYYQEIGRKGGLSNHK